MLVLVCAGVGAGAGVYREKKEICLSVYLSIYLSSQLTN